MRRWMCYIILGYCWQTFGQGQILLQGLVLNGENMFAFENVNIQNISRNLLTVSDRNGAFAIYVGGFDTLKLTAIGFQDDVIPVATILDKLADSFVVVMIPEIYELSAVNIHPLGTYQQFKWKVLALKLPPPVDYMALLRLQKPVESLIPVEYDYKKVYHPLSAIFHPITYFYKRFNKEEQAKIRAYQFLTEEWPIITVVEKKYNGGRVAAITGLEGDSLLQFMAFCNFDQHYLYVTSEYDIGEAVVEKLKEFRKQQVFMRKPDDIQLDTK